MSVSKEDFGIFVQQDFVQKLLDGKMSEAEQFSAAKAEIERLASQTRRKKRISTAMRRISNRN